MGCCLIDAMTVKDEFRVNLEEVNPRSGLLSGCSALHRERYQVYPSTWTEWGQGERQTMGELYTRRGPGAGLSMAWMPLTSQMPLRATSKDSGLVPESLKMGDTSEG